MTPAFRTKSLPSAETLGDRLARLREEMGVTPDDVEAATEVPSKYIVAIEAGRYDDLPGDVYIRNFLKRYAQFLEVNEETILTRYDDERRAFRDIPSATAQQGAVLTPHRRRIILEPKLFRRLIIVAVILAALAYLAIGVTRINRPPELIVDSPSADVRIREERILVSGRTEAETRVLLNGEDIAVERDGTFRETIDLRPGLNILQITAQKKNRKEQVVTRTVFREK